MSESAPRPPAADFAGSETVSRPNHGEFRIEPVTRPEQLDQVRALLTEYARSLDFHLCFQQFERELAGLPGAYAPPDGGLWCATRDGTAAGCVALRRVDAVSAEMKRLYVRPGFRGLGLGRELAQVAINAAQAAGYSRVQLDTLPVMRAAIRLYQAMGFRRVGHATGDPHAPIPLELPLWPPASVSREPS